MIHHRDPPPLHSLSFMYPRRGKPMKQWTKLSFIIALSTILCAASPSKKSSSDHVTAISFHEKTGQLLVGYEDGKLARIDTRRKRGKLHTMDRKKNAIIAIAPNGASAVLDSKPIAVIETKRGKHLAEVSKIDTLEDAVYTPNGDYLLISGPDKVLIWKDANNLTSLSRKGIRLEEYLSRQDGDRIASLGEMHAQMNLLDEGPTLLFGNKEGLLTLWDMRNEQEANFIAKLPLPHTVRMIHGKIAFVASQEDKLLHVFYHENGKRLAWDKSIKADDALSTPEGIAIVLDKTITLHHPDTGEVIWTDDSLAEGSSCGMAFWQQKKKQHLAVCQDDTITLYDITSGKKLSRYTRSKSKIKSLKIK